jgi:hypothetical protein
MMETKCYLLGIGMLIVGLVLGFAANNVFNPGSGRELRSQLLINDIEWRFEGDFLVMHIPVENIGTMPVSVESIGVREDVTGSTEYVDLNPRGINSGSNGIASGGAETFAWNATSGSAPFDFLLPGNTYVVKVTVHDGIFERTTTAHFEF